MQLTPDLGTSVRDDEDEPELLLADGRSADTWRGDHPYDSRLARAEYEHDERLLQIELLELQRCSRSRGSGSSSCARGATRPARAGPPRGSRNT